MSWLSTFYPGDSAAMSVAAYLVQMTLLLAGGLLLARRYRWDAAMRHHVLMLTWVAVAALPVFTWGLGSSPFVAGWQRLFLDRVSAWVAAAPDESFTPAPVAIDKRLASPAPVATTGSGPLPVAASAPVTAALDHRVGVVALGLVWLGGLLAGLVRLGNAARKLAGVRRRSTPAEQRIGVVCEQVARELGLTWCPEVRLSADCGGPVLIGLWRPTLLFPEWIAETLPPEKLRQVVVHEMAHVARHDHLVVWGQHLFSAWFWFHPLAVRFNRELAQAREELCDNHVLSNAAETDYGYTLLSVAEAAGEAVAPRLAVGLFTETWSLESRIAQILHDRRKTMTRVSWSRASAAGLGALSLTAALALCSPLAAHETSTEKAVELTVEVEAPDDGEVEEILVAKGAAVTVTKGPDGKVEVIHVKPAKPHKTKIKGKADKHFFYHKLDGHRHHAEIVIPPITPAPPADLIEGVLVELKAVAEEDPLASNRLAKILEKHLLHANEHAHESHLHAKKVELRLLEAEAALAEEEAAKVDHKHQKKEKRNDPFATDQSRVEALLEKELLETQRELAIQKQRFKELERRIKLANERATERDRERVKETPEAAERE